MQITSSGWSSVVNSSYRPLNTGVLISWNKTVASGINFFTINTSLIGGIDIIRGDSAITGPSFFDKYLYGDYTAQVKNWSVQRDIGQFPFGLIMAQADVELDNSSRMFLPGVDTTIGSGILPGRPLKISTGMNQDNLSQFTGFTGQPEISITGRNVHLHAFDVMDYLNNYSFVPTSGTTFSGMLTNVTTASAIGYYLNKLGFNANQSRLDASLQQPIGVVNVTDRKFGQVLQDLVAAEQGILHADESGVINFWNRQHFVTTSGLGPLFNFNYSNSISLDYSNAPIINDVKVIAKPRAVNVFQQVWKTPTYQTVLPGQSLTLFADLADQDGPLPTTSITTPTYSASENNTSYYTTNAASDGSGAALNASITLTSTYLFGTIYKMVFANSDTNTVYLTDLRLYGTPATVTSRFSERYFDQASIDNYGRNPSNNGDVLEISNDYLQSSSDALALAFTIVSQYSAPNRHYTVETFSNPALQIGDYGTVDPDSSGVRKTVWITGKTDKLNPGGALTQVLKLEERTLYTYFTINQSSIASSDVIAP